MKSKFFIDNPIFSGVISLAIVALGIIAFTKLPVERYPEIAPPTVTVTATYPGAKAETVLKSVVAPIEEAINGVKNVNYITSTANNDGVANITVFFHHGSDLDIATIDVQNCVTTVSGILPSEVVKGGIITESKVNAELKTMMLYSPDNSFPEDYIDNYMSSIVVPRIERVKGVGSVLKYGSEYALRVWLDPNKMAQYGLVPSDVVAAIDDQNIEIGTGAFGENFENVYQYSLKYRGRLTTPEEFGDVVIRSTMDGNVLKLKDVARLEMGRQAYSILETVEGKHGSGIAIYQSDESNANETIKRLNKEFESMAQDLPKGLEFTTLNDANRFLFASIRDVAMAFILSIILVLAIVYFFLQNFKATLIPAIGIIVSIIGTFGFLYVVGFSINLLTLFALVLCIGTVVDDSIVVVEAVQAKYNEGYTSHYKATSDAMGEVSLSIVISTLIFMSVFIPLAMIGGTSGKFYTQFGLTMAASVGISAINALTLAPVLSILLIHPNKRKDGTEREGFSRRFQKAFIVSFNALTAKYKRSVEFFVKKKWLVFSVLSICIAALLYLASTTKTSLIPQEDTCIAFVCTNATPGTALKENHKSLQRLDSLIRTFPEVELCVEESGYSFLGTGPNMGQFFILLKDWRERRGEGMSADDVVAKIYSHAGEFPELNMIAMQNSMIPGYSSGSNFELYLQDKNDESIEKFKSVSDQFVSALNERSEIELAYASFSSDYPQYKIDVDASQCVRAGVSVKEVLSTLGTYLGGEYVSNFNRFSRIYRVMVQSAPEYRVTPESLSNFYVRTAGGMAPLSQFVTLSKDYGPEYLTRFNLFNSIPISASPAAGYSTGDALEAINQVADSVLPSGYDYEYGGLTREEESTNNNLLIITLISIILIYMILSSLYGSFLLPFVVILAVPCGLAGSFLFTRFFGLENNIYLQTAVVMLIGLLSKTAILITDYARNNRKNGMSIVDSAIDAAQQRLRPILMTSLTMIFGMLPLMFATGAGAKSNATIGASTVGGMVLGTLAMLVIVPVLWIIMQTLHEKILANLFKK